MSFIGHVSPSKRIIYNKNAGFKKMEYEILLKITKMYYTLMLI